MEGISELKTELSGTRIEKIKFIKHLINENNDKINKTIKKIEQCDLEESLASLEPTPDMPVLMDSVCSDLLAEYRAVSDRMTDMLAVTTSRHAQLEEHCQRYLAARRAAVYTRWLKHISVINKEIGDLIENHDYFEASDKFRNLCDLSIKLNTSRCKHLRHYVDESVKEWNITLKSHLVAKFEVALKANNWPVVSSSGGVSGGHNGSASASGAISGNEETDKKCKTMAPLFLTLLRFQMPDHIAAVTNKYRILEPMKIMLEPFSKRFSYHFYGNRVTNNIDKPEWYLSQILIWIKENREFLIKEIQPLLEKAELPYCAVEQLERGLVNLLIDKIRIHARAVADNEYNYSHLIDEIIAFETELFQDYTLMLPLTNVRCISVLTEDKDLFSRWINIERIFAQDKMDFLFKSPTAWCHHKFQDPKNPTNTPECAEMFISLLVTMTERYKMLPQAADRLVFLNLQKHLIDEFRIRLIQKLKEPCTSSEKLSKLISPRYPAIVNCAYYIFTVLSNWQELVFFLQLQQEEDLQQKIARISLQESQEDQQDQQLFETREDEFDFIEGPGILNEQIQLFRHIHDEMVTQIVGFASNDILDQAVQYKHNSWLNVPSGKYFIVQTLSPSACDFLYVLKVWLHYNEKNLSKHSFKIFWVKIAERINDFVFKEVILNNTFTRDAAEQFQYDMTDNLFPIFISYTIKPENYMKQVKESCILLNLAKGTNLLLKEVLLAPDTTAVPHGAKAVEPRQVLRELGIHRLNTQQVLRVLKCIID